MRTWTVRDGMLLQRGDEDVAAPVRVQEMLACFRDGKGVVELEAGGQVRASRWALTPRIVLDVVDGRAHLAVAARGGAADLVIYDLAALEAGHVVADLRWFPLAAEATRQILDVLSDIGATLGALSLRQLLDLRAGRFDAMLVEDRIETVTPDLFETRPLDDEEAPQGILAKLYPYQVAGWRWLRFLARHGLGGLLADEMGLGKTLQIISLLADAGKTSLRPCLVIAPGTLLENWRREIEKFAPALRVLVHGGDDRTGSPRELVAYDIIVTSYDTVVRDNGLLATVEWEAVVLDEAQAIRNPGTARAAAVSSLRRARGFAITGTPVENRLLDLYSIISFVAPGHLGTQREFEETFKDDPEGGALLEPLVSPLMLRRRVAEVATDLPERIDIDVPLVMSKVDGALYDELRNEALRDFGSVGPLVAMTRLRQFCAHPAAAGLDYPDPHAFPKLARLLEIAEEVFAAGEKLIVFSAFTEVTDIIMAAIRRRLAVWADHLDGRVDMAARQGVVDAFSAVSGAAALILNPRVAGAGLNITAATHVIHYGLEWNPALEAQASARAWRRGQDRPVTIHRLFFADTVEEIMNERLMRKRGLAEAAVIGVEGTDDDRSDALAALSLSPSKGGRNG